MADHGSTGGNMDIRDKQDMYKSFMSLTKWSIIFLVILLAAMATFLTND